MTLWMVLILLAWLLTGPAVGLFICWRIEKADRMAKGNRKWFKVLNRSKMNPPGFLRRLFRMHSPSACYRYAAGVGFAVGMGKLLPGAGWCSCPCRMCRKAHPRYRPQYAKFEEKE